MSENTWSPKYIKRELNYRAQDVLSAAEYNAILNLLIAQGDHNSAWLEWLAAEGLKQYFDSLSDTTLSDSVVEKAQELLNALAATSVNKTSAYLNHPLITIVDEGHTTSGTMEFVNALEAYGLFGCVSCYGDKVTTGADNTSIAKLRDLAQRGHTVVYHGYKETPLTEENVSSVVDAGIEHLLSVYDGYTPHFTYVYNTEDNVLNETVREYITTHFLTAVGTEQGINDSDAYDAYWLKVIDLSSATNEEVFEAIEFAILHNQWCIIKVCTDPETYDEAAFSFMLDTVKEATQSSDLLVKNIVNAYADVRATINNRIDALLSMFDAHNADARLLANKLTTVNSIRWGHKENGFPENPSEGDVYIMF
jgi:hypothetical protein